MKFLFELILFVVALLSLLPFALRKFRQCREYLKTPPRKCVPLWVSPTLASILCILLILFFATTSRMGAQQTLSPVLSDYWQTLSNTANSNVSITITNGQNVTESNQPIYILKNGCSLMVKLSSTNIVTATNVVTINGDISIDGITNTTTHPFTWTITNNANGAGTNIYYTNLSGGTFNNCASLTIDQVTNNTLGALGGNTNATTINWIEYGIANN